MLVDPTCCGMAKKKAERRPRGAWFSKEATVLDSPPHSVGGWCGGEMGWGGSWKQGAGVLHWENNSGKGAPSRSD